MVACSRTLIVVGPFSIQIVFTLPIHAVGAMPCIETQFTGHTNEKNFVGLRSVAFSYVRAELLRSVNAVLTMVVFKALTLLHLTVVDLFDPCSISNDFIACGSENNAVYTYYKSLSSPVIVHRFTKGSEDDPSVEDTSNFVSSVCTSNACVLL